MTIAHTRGGSPVTGSPYTPADLETFLEASGSDVQPGDLFTIAPGTDFTGLINISIHANHSGTRDQPVKVTGGPFTGYTELVGAITWSVPDTWSATPGDYVTGDVVEYSGAFYCAEATMVAANVPGAHADWQVIGGTVWAGDLTDVVTPFGPVSWISIDGSMVHSRREVGENAQTYAPIFQADLEWSCGPAWSATTLYIRSDSGAPGAGGPSSIKIAMGYGVFRTGQVDYWTFEDIDASELGCLVHAGFNGDTATADRLGLVMRRVTQTQVGVGCRFSISPATTDGGPPGTLRNWLIEDCHINKSTEAGFWVANVGGGVVRGCSVTDPCLSISIGAYYAGSDASGGLPAGTSHDAPDDVWFIDCHAFGTGLYTEWGGIGNYYNGDRQAGLYTDGRVKNVHFIGGTTDGIGTALQSNSGGGFVEWVGIAAHNGNRFALISNSNSGNSGSTNIENCSAVSMSQTPTLYTTSLENTHTITNTALHTTGLNKHGVGMESAVATVAVTNCEFEGQGMTGVAGGPQSGQVTPITSSNYTANADTNTTFFESLTSCRIASSSALAYAGAALWADTPVLYLTENTDDCWIDHGLTSDIGWTVAFTGSFDGTNNTAAWLTAGSDDSNAHKVWLTSGLTALGRKEFTTTEYDTGASAALTADVEYRFVYSFNPGSGSDMWVNGTKLTNQYDTSQPVVISGTPPAGTFNLLSLADGTHTLDGTVRDLLTVELTMTDAEKAAL